MKIIWTGTDSLFLVKFPKFQSWKKLPYILALRLFAKIADIFAEQHYSCGELVHRNLQQFGVKKKIVYFHDLMRYLKQYEKSQHEGFNIIYYYPKKQRTRFWKWIYGIDTIEALKGLLMDYKDIHFIELDGTQDMEQIYPIADLYIRPNNHDGQPRIIDECINNSIPFIWSNEKPDLNHFLAEILRHYNQKTWNF